MKIGLLGSRKDGAAIVREKNRKEKHKKKMGKNYQRVKRGMVFWFDIDESVNKHSQPKVTVDGKQYSDNRQYGYRDWLVVSNDTNNSESPTCNIVPLTSSDSKSNIPTHVKFNCKGNVLTILCEQMMTINSIQLQKYDFTVDDEIMEKVEDALRVQYSIRDKKRYTSGAEESLSKIEEIIENIIRSKVEQLKPKQADTVEIEDAVLRIGESLEALFGKEETSSTPVSDVGKEEMAASEIKDEPRKVEKEERAAESEGTALNKDTCTPKKPVTTVKRNQSQVDKFYSKYPNLNPNKDKKEAVTPDVKKTPGDSSSKKKRKVWTEESMREFLKDVDVMPPTEVAAKWEMDSVQKMYQMKYYVKNKLEGLRK